VWKGGYYLTHHKGEFNFSDFMAWTLGGALKGTYYGLLAANFGAGLAATLGGVLAGQAAAPLVTGVLGMGVKGAWYIMDKEKQVTMSGLLLAMGTGFAYGAGAWVNPAVAVASFGVGLTESLGTHQLDKCASLYDVIDAGTGMNWYSGTIGLDSAVANRLPGAARGIYRFATSGKGAASVTAVGATFLVGSAGPLQVPACAQR
jgi:hypothetical protein